MSLDAPKVVSGTVAERWEAIRSWLQSNHPHALKGFLAPASEAQIVAAEETLGTALPEDYRQFLAIHNGQDEFAAATMEMTCALVPVEKMHELRQSYSEVFDEDNVAVEGDINPAIRPVEHSQGWLPIGRSARGRDYVCLDMDPTEKGTKGQVIRTAVDFNDHELLAPSFADFLSRFLEDLQSGDSEVDEDDDE